MTSPPSTKAAFKRSLDNYRAGRLRPTTEAPGATNAAAKTGADKPSADKPAADQPNTTKDTQPK
jgi:hypothetical protein